MSKGTRAIVGIHVLIVLGLYFLIWLDPRNGMGPLLLLIPDLPVFVLLGVLEPPPSQFVMIGFFLVFGSAW